MQLEQGYVKIVFPRFLDSNPEISIILYTGRVKCANIVPIPYVYGGICRILEHFSNTL